ncbi:hypothetical protein Ciccas_013194 [Cichlidogyrus casuarinus]|uniref:Uncharacterized protein n=1 Tax=Cichlidogyrus casuarinus TaxID=1844966 RepID=A0ABD2PMB0_9PLAT
MPLPKRNYNFVLPKDIIQMCQHLLTWKKVYSGHQHRLIIDHIFTIKALSHEEKDEVIERCSYVIRTKGDVGIAGPSFHREYFQVKLRELDINFLALCNEFHD